MTIYSEFEYMLDKDKQKVNIDISKRFLVKLDEYLRVEGLNNRKVFIELLVYKFIQEQAKYK